MSAIELSFLALLIVLVMAISVVDLAAMRIPNTLNLSLAIAGAGLIWLTQPEALLRQLLFAGLMIMVLFTIRQIHMWASGRTGLGLGDVKMGGAAAIWVHPTHFPLLIFFASGGALLGILAGKVISGVPLDTKRRIPFGPFIGLALIMTWVLEMFGYVKVG